MNSTLLDENFTSILNTTSNDLTFTDAQPLVGPDPWSDIILNPFFYGSSIIFIILILCIITFIIILKNKKKSSI